jgi:hypothetical protein
MSRPGLIIFLSLIFFLAEVLVVIHYEDRLNVLAIKSTKTYSKISVSKDWRWGISATKNVMRANEDNGARLFLLGGSTALKFFAHNSMISNIQDLEVYDLMAPTQTMFEKLMLVDAIKRNKRPGIVLFALHPVVLAYDNPRSIVQARYFGGKNYRYGINSQLAESFYQDTAWNISPPLSWRLLKSANLVLSMINQIIMHYLVIDKGAIQNLVAGPLIKHPKADLPGLDRTKRVEQIKHRMASFSQQNAALAVELLDIMAEACAQRNLKMIIFELPYGNIYRHESGQIISFYNRATQELTAKHENVLLCKIPYDVYGGKECLFSDGVHVLPYASKYFSEPFARLLKERILPEAGLSDIAAGLDLTGISSKTAKDVDCKASLDNKKIGGIASTDR